jgi:hypothetical protein
MDFQLITEHPWATAGIVAGGALVLYLYWKNGTSTAATDYSTTGYAASTAEDPNAIAAATQVTLAQTSANAQITQLSAQLQGLSIQSATQIQLAQIQAASTANSTAVGANTTGITTAADLQAQLASLSDQLQLGLGTQQSNVDMANIQAGVQIASINAVAAAYAGQQANNVQPAANPPVTNINITMPSNPTQSAVVNPSSPVSPTPVTPDANTASNIPACPSGQTAVYSQQTGMYACSSNAVTPVGRGNPNLPGGAVTSGRSAFVATGSTPDTSVVYSAPTLSPEIQAALDATMTAGGWWSNVQMPTNGVVPCSSTDAACVARNTSAGANYQTAIMNAMAENNATQQIRNYSLNNPNITPSQQTELQSFQNQLIALEAH